MSDLLSRLEDPRTDGAIHLRREAAAALRAAETRERRLREALERCLNFIENTESEMGETLSCGDAARAALAATGESE